MDVSQVVNCAFPVWYPKFKKITWKSITIPLSDEFVNYLKADGGVILPVDDCIQTAKENDEIDDEDETDWEDPEPAMAPHFPELDQQIKSAIKTLGGSVFPKLNWSSAKDATWISMNNSMMCVTPSDVYLLLKSSIFITHDLTQPFVHCARNSKSPLPEIKYELVLRKWIDVNPAMEFRCFVKNNVLIGITQRDASMYNPYIAQQRADIVQDIMSLYKEHICNNFPDNNYVFDVYREYKDSVVVVDFNPFGKTTDSILFDWDELLLETFSNCTQIPELRFITESIGVQPSPYRSYGLPKDVTDLSLDLDTNNLIDMLRLQTNKNDTDDHTDSTEQL